MSKRSKAPSPSQNKIKRRDFLRIGSLAGVAATMAAPQQLLAQKINPAPKSEAIKTNFPVVDIAPLAEIKPGTDIQFEYPDADSPAVLVRLNGSAQGGIGPNESIVAFSSLCTHKGCPVGFKKERSMFICPCHWSSFDPAKAGRIIIGQASEPLPQITLRITDGMVQAVGVSGLIYGRHTNIL